MVTIDSKEPMAMCPMASMCRGIAKKPPPLMLLLIPGVVLVVIGVLILVEPRVLTWLIAVVSILLGAFLLAVATWIRRMLARIHNTTAEGR